MAASASSIIRCEPNASISATAALLVPSLHLEAGRLQDTRHVFANAGDPAEGARRLAAWEWASRCEPQRPMVLAAQESIAQGVDAVIAVDCGRDDAEIRRRVLGHAGGRFVEVLREDGYVLYLRR